MTDGLRMSHLRKAPQVGLFEVGLPDIYLQISLIFSPDPFSVSVPIFPHLYFSSLVQLPKFMKRLLKSHPKQNSMLSLRPTAPYLSRLYF